MKIISEELCALIPSMTIIYTKEGALGPVINLAFFALRFHNVKNNCHPILIIVPTILKSIWCLPNDSLVSIGSVSCNDSILLGRVLSIFIVSQNKTVLLNTREFIPETFEQLPFTANSIVPCVAVHIDASTLRIPCCLCLQAEEVAAAVVSRSHIIVHCSCCMSLLAVVKICWVPGLLQKVLVSVVKL